VGAGRIAQVDTFDLRTPSGTHNYETTKEGEPTREPPAIVRRDE
jgi:hypothetical protein